MDTGLKNKYCEERHWTVQLKAYEHRISRESTEEKDNKQVPEVEKIKSSSG